MSSLTVTQANCVLLEAVRNTDLQRFDYAITLGADLTALTEGHRVGALALREAIELINSEQLTANRIAIIEQLLKMEKNAREPFSFEAAAIGPLFKGLALQGQTETMNQLLFHMRKCKEISVLTAAVEMALCEAASYGQEEFVETLLRRRDFLNPDKEHNQKNHDQAIERAQANGHEDVVALIRHYDANYVPREQGRHTPPHAVVHAGLYDEVKRLLAAGIHPDAISAGYATPLTHAARMGRNDIAKLLVESGANLRAFTDDGCLLFSAAGSGMNWLIEACIEAGEKVDHQNISGVTALICAAHTGQIETMQLLVERGANINHAEHRFGNTPLHAAIGNGHENAVQWLVEQGADLNAEFKKPGIGMATPLMNAVANVESAIVKMLIAAGANVCAGESGKGNTALHYAADGSKMEGIAFQLQAEADDSTENNDLAAFLEAIQGKSIEEIVLMLQTKIYNTTRYQQLTSFFTAVIRRNNEIAMLLVGDGADINAQNQARETPLHNAASGGRFEMVAMLLAAGADRNILNTEGQTALDLAVRGSFPSVVELLQN